MSYLKLAFSVLRRRKFFTFISLFGISMTLVVLMVATAVLDNVLAPRSPESRFDRVAIVSRVAQKGPHSTMSTDAGFALIDRFVKPLTGAEAVSAYTNPHVTPLYKDASRVEAMVRRTDGEYWRILDFTFLEGRPFTAAEDASGAHVAVISDAMGEKLFGAQRAEGRSFELEGEQYRVIGVVPRVSIARQSAFSDVWVPIGTIASSSFRHELTGGFSGMVLAKRSSDIARLQREFATRMRAYPLDGKEFTEVRTGLDTPFEAVARTLTSNQAGTRGPWIVIGAFVLLAILFMTLPALNLVTLNLSRILERAPEIGVRKAFGAPRHRLVSQFVFENVVLTVMGGIAGFVLSVAVLAALTRSNAIPNADFDINLRIFLCGMLVAVFFGVFSGLYPAWRMSRLDPVNALRGGAR